MRSVVSLNQKIAVMRERNAAPTAPIPGTVTERIYTAHDVAGILRLSDDKVRRMFQDEPGVLVIGDGGTKHKRRYTTLRIPESVLERVLRRMSNV
jgi:hypothetical protein